ncbi:hypothetical protein BC830DRAFT_1131916 [Chytriomyces sp. MP71]|nr:hypothetical protein BC830DRAFT_1131916 [Chytriomyces sp. MP71]
MREPPREYSRCEARHAPLEQQVEVDDIELEVYVLRGFRASLAREILAFTISLATLGLAFLVARWFPLLGARLRAKQCPLAHARWVVVESPHGETAIATVHTAQLAPGALADIFTGYSEQEDELAQIVPFSTLRYFHYQHIKFMLNPVTLQFETILNWKDAWWGYASDTTDGIASASRIQNRATVFGVNEINIPHPNPLYVAIDEILHPFFIFQVLCCVQWFLDDYAAYGNFVTFILFVSIVTAYMESRDNAKRLQEMCGGVDDAGTVRVRRFGNWIQLDARHLVPGDVIEITSSEDELPCDAVLMEGTCIMNEYVLTGESSPVSKNPISTEELATLNFSEEDPSNSRLMSRWFLFAGTTVVRALGAEYVGNFQDASAAHGAIALVVRTGINTTMGSLIRSILYPKPHTLQYIKDSFTYLGVLSVIATISVCTTLYRFHKADYPWDVILLRSFDLITITVPITLPATIAVGVGFSILRLQKMGIFCISSAKVNICGQVEVMCFDKTGTLTQEGLDMVGFRCVIPRDESTTGTARFTPILNNVADAYTAKQDNQDLMSASISSLAQMVDLTPMEIPQIVAAMASCHSLKVLNGELIGDPVDRKMFAFSEWEIDEAAAAAGGGSPAGFASIVVRPRGNADFGQALRESVTAGLGLTAPRPYTEVGVIRSFEFGSHLRRMSVITRRLTFSRTGAGLPGVAGTPVAAVDFAGIGSRPSKEFDVYCKGAPEVIVSLCDPASVPPDHASLLRRYAHKGFHVIAIATKVIPNVSWLKLMRMTREQVESNMEFLGFLVFENKLKPVTKSVVQHLNSAKIYPIMCTGDNVLTAISVARESGILDGEGCRVFVPRFEGDSRDADAVIVWEDVDQDEVGSNVTMQLELDPVTLKPVIAIKTTQDDVDEDHFFIPERFIEVEVKGEYQLAVTGEVFSWMHEFADRTTSFYRMLVKAQVFARMSPEQKKQLVLSLQEIGYCVGFCGDGANDWGALQTADVGVSLSEVEVSVAAPFTSKYSTIACIVTLIREGRGALVTSFGSCKYMIVNSLIQFTSVMLLYTIYSNLSDTQFPYVDLLITVPVAIFMSESGPHDLLAIKRPTSSLMSKKVIFSILGQFLIQTSMQIAIFRSVRDLPFYTPPAVDISKDAYRCYESTVVFLLSTYQYLFTAIVYCDGAPYRQDFWRNKRFVLTLAILLSASIYLTLFPSESALAYLDLISLPLEGRLFVLLFAALDLLVTTAAEVWVIPLISKLVGWAMIEYSSYEEDPEGEVRYPEDNAEWIESERGKRHYRAIRRRWRRKGKYFKIVEQDLE